MDVAAWLQGLGLERYAPAFRDNDVDAEVLLRLTAEDLRELGVASIGHRRRLLDAIAALAEVAPPRPTPVPVVGGPLPTPPPPAGEGRVGADAERRQLTVMFCDLVGSTALSARLDPEDLRAVIGAYHRCVAKVIGRGGGFVAKYMGDGVLAYFGYPRADEHDAERAVRAALKLVEKVAALDTVAAAPLQVRVGIATGLVVVGDLIGQGASQEQAVVGETPNLAARLQALAEPGAVVIAPSTRRLTGGLFEYADLGAVELKGLGAPVMAARVVRGSAAESRFEALHGRDLTALVGRNEELALLTRRWQQARAGEGRVVVLIGEPGIGKSRLAQAMLAEPAGEPHTRLRYFCSPHHQASALHPYITQLEHAAGFNREDMPEARLTKLEALLARSNAGAEEIGFIAERMSVPTGDRYRLPDLTPQRRKEKTFEALLAQLARLAAGQPVLMLFEDAHWIDPTSLELLTLTVARASTLPLLLLVTARPEFTPPWPADAHITMQALARLGRREGATLVARSAGGKALPAEILDQILARTDGVPLFLEELTKTIIESGLLREEDGHYALDGALPLLAIPTTLHDSLMARLDRLAPVREVAQIGAAIGREFSYPLLSAVAQQPDDRLQEALDRLVRAELVFGRGQVPEAVYTFKHALVQEAAYASLLRERRRTLHARIAEALENEFPEVAETQPELVAHHYAAAGLAAPAIDHYRRAAERAMAASANADAIAHLTRGLELIGSLPESAERISREIEFRLALGTPLIATQGWASVGAQAVYSRAKELCAGIGETPELFRSLMGLWLYHQMQPDLETASELSRELFDLAAKLGNDEFRLLAELAACSTCFWSGRYADVLSHAARVRLLYDPEHHRGPKIYAIDPAMAALGFESLALWSLGYPERASERGLAALSMDQTVAHPFSLCWALRLEAWLRMQRREPDLMAARTKAYLMVAREQGFAYDRANGSMLEIWHDAWVTGQCADDRIEAFRSALAEWRRMGNRLHLGFWHALFAECLEKQGNTDEALTALEAAVVHFERRGSDAPWEPEVHRLMGDLLLRRNPSAPGRAEVSYRRAIERARAQEAKSWELRAATSLARLWRDQGKPAEARALLAPIYGWFTEGFDTADLKEAKALLEELTSSAIAKRPTENELSDLSPLWHDGCADKSTRHNVWTKITRPKYERAGQRYASDLTDAEWAVIEPHMPATKHLGRPRETDLRAVLDGILYIARTGCQWRMLPKDFPPFTTVQGYFYDWRDNGLFERINFELLLEAREAVGREASPSAGVIDSQSVKTTESGGPRGYDAAKKIKGRKRHIVTDTTGLMVGAAIHPADVQDRDGAPLTVEAIHDLFPWLRHLFADSAYSGDKLLEALAKFGRWSIEIVRRMADTVGFEVLPRRWVVERTFAWLNRNRRLAKDFEASIESAKAWVYVASVQLIARRIA